MAQPNRHLALLRAACREGQLGQLLRSARWEADEVRDEVRSYMVDHLGGPRERSRVARRCCPGWRRSHGGGNRL